MVDTARSRVVCTFDSQGLSGSCRPYPAGRPSRTLRVLRPGGSFACGHVPPGSVQTASGPGRTCPPALSRTLEEGARDGVRLDDPPAGREAPERVGGTNTIARAGSNERTWRIARAGS